VTIQRTVVPADDAAGGAGPPADGAPSSPTG
jgi:hypothetical protein